MSLEKGDMQAILLVASQQEQRLSCPMAPSCYPANPQETIIQLLLAQDAIQPVLDTFMTAWQSGKEQALEWLTPDLRKECQTITALDKRAGFQRGPTDDVQLTWRVMTNQGQMVRLTVQGVLSSKILLPSREIPPLNLEIKDTSTGWKVSEVTQQVIFPPSSDSVLWADEAGRIFRYRLIDDSLQNVAGPGMFHPAGEVPPTNQEKIFVSRIISPDEKLAILYPNPYSDHPEQSVRIRTNDDIRTALWEANLPITPTLTWTSESQNIIVGGKPSQPGPIFRMNAQTGENKKLVDNAYFIGVESSN